MINNIVFLFAFRVSFSIFRHLDRMDVSHFQNTSLGCLAEFAVNTLKPLEVI